MQELLAAAGAISWTALSPQGSGQRPKRSQNRVNDIMRVLMSHLHATFLRALSVAGVSVIPSGAGPAKAYTGTAGANASFFWDHGCFLYLRAACWASWWPAQHALSHWSLKRHASCSLAFQLLCAELRCSGDLHGVCHICITSISITCHRPQREGPLGESGMGQIRLTRIKGKSHLSVRAYLRASICSPAMTRCSRLST